MNAKRRLRIRRRVNLGVSVRIRQRGLVLRVDVADSNRLVAPGRAAGALGRYLEMSRVDVGARFQDRVVRVGVYGRGVVAAVVGGVVV